MKYILWFRSYSKNKGVVGSAWSFNSIEAALNYAKQYSPFSDVYKENKIYIEEDATGEIVMTSKAVKKTIQKYYLQSIS